MLSVLSNASNRQNMANMLLFSKYVVGCVVGMLLDFKSRNMDGEVDMNNYWDLGKGAGKNFPIRGEIPGYTLYKDIFSPIYIVYYYILYMVRSKMEYLT